MRKLTMMGRCPIWICALVVVPSLMAGPALGASNARNMALYGTDNLKLLGPMNTRNSARTEFYTGTVQQSAPAPVVSSGCGPTILMASGESIGCDSDVDVLPETYPSAQETYPRAQTYPNVQAYPSVQASYPLVQPPQPVVAPPPVPPYARAGFGAGGQGSSGFAEGVDFRPYARLRGGMENDSAKGQNFLFETELGFDADLVSALGNYTLGSKILLANPAGDDLAFSSFTNTLSGKIELSSLTNLEIGGRLDILQESLGDEDLTSDTVVPPYYLVGALSGGLSHQFGLLTVTPNATIERYAYGESKLASGAKLSNEERQYWHGQLGLRARLEATPRLAVLGEVFTNASWFDKADPTTGQSRDLSSVGLRIGFEGAWLPQLQVGGGVSASVDKFVDGSDGGDPNWMFDGYLTYQPNDDVTIAAILSSEIAPTELAGARRRVTTSLDLQLSYLSTQDLTLRASLGGDQTRFVGIDGTASNIKIGAGLDYFLSDFVTGTVDLGSAWAQDKDGVLTDKQTIMVGVTVRP